jgi:DNA-binding NarL/FixJ family response regulator
MPAKKIRILIADDHSVVRRGLRALLDAAQDFAVIAEAADGEQAVQLAAEHKPDVVLLDISMPKINGVEAVRIIKRSHPRTRVLMLTIHESEEYVQQVVRAGADGYVLKNADREDLYGAIRAVVEGKQFFSPDAGD